MAPRNHSDFVDSFEESLSLHCFDHHHEFKKASSSKEELEALKKFSRHGLAYDESSDHFLSREKAIAFVYVKNGQIFRLRQNYFVQASSYNDFSGGYKRFYKLIPEKILNKAAKQEILNFQRYHGIPDKTIMLLQIQSSFAQGVSKKSNSSDDDDDSGSVTGQGIHTDGSCHAMLLCLERENVLGAENSFFNDLNGEQQLGGTTVLEEGDLVYFQDDRIFHHVSPATQADPSVPMRRTIMLIHAPAHFYLSGEENELNALGSRKSETKLRYSSRSRVKTLFSIIGSKVSSVVRRGR